MMIILSQAYDECDKVNFQWDHYYINVKFLLVYYWSHAEMSIYFNLIMFW